MSSLNSIKALVKGNYNLMIVIEIIEHENLIFTINYIVMSSPESLNDS